MRFLAPCLALVLLLALSPIRAQCASNATETVREAINDLLDENPGKEWRGRIKVLQRQAMRREDIPTRLKDAIGELWQMGRTYARGNARKAAELRRRIETVLED